MSLVTESYPDFMGKGNSLLYTEVEGESPLSPFPAAQVKLTVLTMGKDGVSSLCPSLPLRMFSANHNFAPPPSATITLFGQTARRWGNVVLMPGGL